MDSRGARVAGPAGAVLDAVLSGLDKREEALRLELEILGDHPGWEARISIQRERLRAKLAHVRRRRFVMAQGRMALK